MRLNLFSKGDSLLLLGEGNFSFSVGLHKHNLPINITATGFESQADFGHQTENIEYLKSKEVPVFLNVDATKLHENVNFFGMKFSKIIFNFPHIGGKMKIHLNRQLLMEFFQSCSAMIGGNGMVIVSLCQGQGGTPADCPRRRWEDSWQVTEMAAHGDFVLTDVQPFCPENFPEYKCIGYRSQDVKFNLGGALVHVFVKRQPPCTSLSEDGLRRRLGLVPLDINSSALVPVIYSELYNENPLRSQDSCISFFKNLLLDVFPKSGWIILEETEVAIYVEGERGVPCEVHSEKRSLRFSPIDTLLTLIESKLRNQLVLYPGMYFNPLSEDFLNSPPITFHFVILGDDVQAIINQFLGKLINLFGEKDLICISRKTDQLKGKLRSIKEFLYEDTKSGKSFVAAQVYSVEGKAGREAAVVNAQKICEHFFQICWREIWAEGHKVQYLERPTWKSISLYPSTYKFDLTLRYTKAYEEKELIRILWLAAGQLIEGVDIVNEYTSEENWSSKCYRITYKSLDKPLYRSRVVDIHSNIVGRMLELEEKVQGFCPSFLL